MWLSHRHTTAPERCVGAERRDKMKERPEQRTDSSRGKGDWWEQMEVKRKKGKWPGLQEDGAPRRPCAVAESQSRLYLAQGPQIVKRAPGPCVQTGKDRCHPSRGPGPGTIPSHAIAREEWGDPCRLRARLLYTCAELITVCQSSKKQEDAKPWKLLMGGVSPPHFALPRGVFVFTAFPPPLHSSLPLSSWKGHTYPPSHLPTSAEIYQKITHLVSLDRTDIQSKCQSSSSQFFFFCKPVCYLPPSPPPPEPFGGGGHVSGDWWRPEPFRHHSLLEVWQDWHVEPAWSVVKRCSSEWLSTRYIRLKDQTLDGGGLERLAVSSLTERGGRGQPEIMSAVMHADKLDSR